MKTVTLEVRAPADAMTDFVQAWNSGKGRRNAHIAFATPREDGQIDIHCSTQHPTEVQHIVARAMAKPDAMIRVECRRMGGGFGGKESQPALFASLCAMAGHAGSTVI